MFEEEGRGMFSDVSSRGKVSFDPVEHEGVKSSEVIPTDVWTSLVDADGKAVDVEKVMGIVDVIVVYCDPR